MSRRLLRLITLLTLLAFFVVACGDPRSRGRRGGGGDDDDSAPDDDDDSGTDDDDAAGDDDDDDSTSDDDDDDDSTSDDDDDASDDDDSSPTGLDGFWTGIPTGTVDVGGSIYGCDPETSSAEVTVTEGALAEGEVTCVLDGIGAFCTASWNPANVLAGTTPTFIDCANEYYSLEWTTDGQTYLDGHVSGTADVSGSDVTFDVYFSLSRLE